MKLNKKREELMVKLALKRKSDMKHKIADDRKTKYLANINKVTTHFAILDVEAADTQREDMERSFLWHNQDVLDFGGKTTIRVTPSGKARLTYHARRVICEVLDRLDREPDFDLYLSDSDVEYVTMMRRELREEELEEDRHYRERT